MYEATLTVPAAPPFRLDLTAWVLRRREKNAIDRWNGHAHSRILVLEGEPVKITTSQSGTPMLPQLHIILKSHARLSPEQQVEAQVMVQKMLGLAIDAKPFYDLASRNQELNRLAQQFTGVRPTRFPSVFEALANAIACQQVSLDAGLSLLNRLAEAYGPEFSDASSVAHAFPLPESLLDVPEENLKQLGFSHQKARAIKEVAYTAVNDELYLEQLELASNEEALASLQAIRGIGRWSAEYVLLRGLGRLDVFPGDDIGGQNNIQNLLGLHARPNYDQLRDLTAAWYPYAGFVYFHLLLGKLHDKGLV